MPIWKAKAWARRSSEQSKRKSARWKKSSKNRKAELIRTHPVAATSRRGQAISEAREVGHEPSRDELDANRHSSSRTCNRRGSRRPLAFYPQAQDGQITHPVWRR